MDLSSASVLGWPCVLFVGWAVQNRWVLQSLGHPAQLVELCVCSMAEEEIQFIILIRFSIL